MKRQLKPQKDFTKSIDKPMSNLASKMIYFFWQ